jgi:multidrug efflux pump subunit AcrB
LVAVTYGLYSRIPAGFLPFEDQGYFFAVMQLPDGAALQRTEQVAETAAYRHFEGRGHFGNVVITHGWKMVISVVTFRRGCGRSRVVRAATYPDDVDPESGCGLLLPRR